MNHSTGAGLDSGLHSPLATSVRADCVPARALCPLCCPVSTQTQSVRLITSRQAGPASFRPPPLASPPTHAHIHASLKDPPKTAPCTLEQTFVLKCRWTGAGLWRQLVRGHRLISRLAHLAANLPEYILSIRRPLAVAGQSVAQHDHCIRAHPPAQTVACLARVAASANV